MAQARTDQPGADSGLSEKPRRQTIQSVSRAARILLTIADAATGLTATEVSAVVGLSLPTTYHLLATLEHERLLVKEVGKRYTLGPAASEIANAPGLRPRPDPAHQRALAWLAATTEETAYLTGWFRGEIRILATVEGSQAVRVAGLRVGLTADVHARASGKVMLAFATDEQRARILDGYEYTTFTPVTVRDRGALDAQLEEIRRTGLFYDTGEYRENVRSLSVPIRDDGQVVAALAVTVPADRYERTEPELVAAILEATQQAERAASKGQDVEA